MDAVFLDFASLGEGISADKLASCVNTLDIHDASVQADVVDKCRGHGAVFTNKLGFDAATLAALPELRYIGLTATGADKVDLQAAREHQVAVTNITAYCTQSVVQHVFAVLLSLTHNLQAYRRDVANGEWQRQDNFCLLQHPVRELSGLTLGVVGYGELGQAVASLACAFGMRVVVARRNADDKRSDRVPLATLLADSDVISLHCPLTAETRHMIDAEALAAMKNDAILINTARGALVDSDALATALAAGSIGGAAIDVLSQEPPTDGNALLEQQLDNLIVTPHIAWAAREARQRAVDQTAENFMAFLAGEQRNRIETGRVTE